MNCNEIQQLFGMYWDLPDEDMRRFQVRQHVKHCKQCAEEFKIWEESIDLIRVASESNGEPDIAQTTVANRVMSRIYEAESWRIPVSDRLYSITNKMRRNFTAAVVLCLLLFSGSFIYSLLVEFKPRHGFASKSADISIYGIHPVASTSVNADSINVQSLSSAVASLSDPFLLKMGPIHTFPDYFLAISILGMVCTLLTMNWMSRTDA